MEKIIDIRFSLFDGLTAISYEGTPHRRLLPPDWLYVDTSKNLRNEKTASSSQKTNMTFDAETCTTTTNFYSKVVKQKEDVPASFQLLSS